VAEALSMPGYRTLDWHALAGPAGLPADRRARIAAAFHHALAKPELQQRLQAAGATPAPSTPDEMEAFIRAEIEHYTRLARTTGIKGE
jgi:tripartite-type tricarboxylate transporter receptor subunit TctC